jgi:PAS domain S-box-containing protein
MRLAGVQDHVHRRFHRLLGWHMSTIAELPRWRHPLFGYLIALLLIGFALGVGLLEIHISSPFSFPGVPLLFGIVLVAFFWGVGPAVFAIMLSWLVLDYLYIPPFGTLSDYGWDGLLQLLTFAAAGIVVAILANQREQARLDAIVAEREAMLQAQQLAATFDAIDDSIVVYSKKGEVLQTNSATHRLFGISVLPLNDQEEREQDILCQVVQNDEHGQLLPEKRQPLPRILQGEHLTKARGMDVLVHAPGRDMVLNLSGAPIIGEKGTIERAVLIYRDVTTRRHLERRTSNALQAMLALAQVLVQLPERLTQDEEAAFQNTLPEQMAQRIVELAASTVESKHVVMLTVNPGDDNVSLLAASGLSEVEKEVYAERLANSPHLVNALGGETLAEYLKEDELLLLDGMSLPLYTPVLPYYVQTVLVAPICVDGKLVGLLCIDNGNREHSYTKQEMTLIQISARLTALLLAKLHLQRERAQAQANELAMREANRRMEEFLSLVCHELKTPLTITRGSIQLAERKVKRLISSQGTLSDEVRRFAPVQALLERARNSITLQDRLVSDLLDISRIQAQTLKLFVAPCNLVNIVQEVVEGQRQMAFERAIHLEMPLESEVIVQADADRIVQVLANFLTNALTYAPTDQPIDVCLSTDGEEARIAVRDEGPGLAKVEQERIWERFYRVPGVKAQDKQGVGLGVGLHLCRAIIEQHGGRVGVQSTQGQGSTFWMTLPLAGRSTNGTQ